MKTSLGSKIHSLRKEKKLTLEQLAEKTESSKGYIWELENRETKKPSAEKLKSIADALGVSIEFLLDEKKASPDESMLKEAFFRKFENLKERDQQKILQMIETWGDEK